MNTIANLLRKFETLDTDKVSERAVDQTKGQLLDENKAQLFAGKLNTGQNLTPTYQEDPYFKTPGAAQRYSDWKDRITPNSDRESGVPNLFINGTFFASISIVVDGQVISFDSSFAPSIAIAQKFTDNIYGLGGKYKAEYVDDDLRPVFKVGMEQATGLKLQ